MIDIFRIVWNFRGHFDCPDLRQNDRMERKKSKFPEIMKAKLIGIVMD